MRERETERKKERGIERKTKRMKDGKIYQTNKHRQKDRTKRDKGKNVKK